MLLLGFSSLSLYGGDSLENPNEPNRSARLSKLEFNGYMDLSGEITVSLFDSVSSQNLWIPLDGAKRGIRVISLDLDSGSLVVEVAGTTRTIMLQQSDVKTSLAWKRQMLASDPDYAVAERKKEIAQESILTTDLEINFFLVEERRKKADERRRVRSLSRLKLKAN